MYIVICSYASCDERNEGISKYMGMLLSYALKHKLMCVFLVFIGAKTNLFGISLTVGNELYWLTHDC